MEKLNITTTKDNEKVYKILGDLMNANKEFQIMITVPSTKNAKDSTVKATEKKEQTPEVIHDLEKDVYKRQEDARCLREQEEAGKRKKMLLLFGILLSLGGFAVILLGQGVIGGVLVVLGIAAVAAALLFTAGRSKDQTGENTELSRLEQEMEELEAQVCIEAVSYTHLMQR